MDNEMIDLMAGDAVLRRRMDVYAELRLSPDLATSSRIRARVLAVAHRHADLARADAALTIVTAATPPSKTAVRAGHRWGRALVGLLAAALVLGASAGSVFAARPGGPLYEPRLWLETLTLPSDPSQRALAELDRLDHRLAEAKDAVRSGDSAAAAAALEAYATIMEQASSAAIAAQDDVAVAVLETGVGHNVDVLQALILALPDQAADAIERAVQRAIDRSDRTIDKIERGQPGGGPNANPGGDPGARPTRAPTPEPTPKPTKKPAGGPPGGGPDGGQPTSTGAPGKPDKPPKPSTQHGQD
jgi:predicted RecA/RadA family phage recombinase